MQKKMGFGQRQHCYGDGGMRMDSASEEESYFFHDESWSSENNNFHKQHPAMQMNRLGGGMFQEGMHSDHGFGHGYARHGGGRKFPYGGSGGGGRLSSGGQHREYFSEETEYEECYREEHVGPKFGEMRYEKNNWGGETCYANGYDRNMISNMNYKPHKVQWTAKGV